MGLESKGRSNYFGIPNGTLVGFTLDSCKNLCRNATEISVGIFCRWNVTKVAAGISPVSPLSFSRRVLSLRWGAGLLESLPHHWSTVWLIIFCGNTVTTSQSHIPFLTLILPKFFCPKILKICDTILLTIENATST